MITTVEIPVELMVKIREFLLASKTGNITLSIKDGKVMSWKVEEHCRLTE